MKRLAHNFQVYSQKDGNGDPDKGVAKIALFMFRSQSKTLLLNFANMEMPKIFLVDDDYEDRSIIIDALNDLESGDLISCAENGEAALKKLEEFAELDAFPSLIILDLNMPKMNGVETLRRLKEDRRFAEIPVTIYSTSINPLDKEACINLGAQLYITKPTSYKESIEIARRFIKMCDSEVGSRK